MPRSLVGWAVKQGHSAVAENWQGSRKIGRHVPSLAQVSSGQSQCLQGSDRRVVCDGLRTYELNCIVQRMQHTVGFLLGVYMWTSGVRYVIER